MKKIVFSLLTASTLLFTATSPALTIASPITQTNTASSTLSDLVSKEGSTYTYEDVEQVASSKATAKSGSFKMKYNTNVRADAGTKNKVVTLAKKGSAATATHQKKFGKETWYKVKVNGKSGWVLSTLLTPVKAKAAPKAKAKAAPKAKAPAATKLTGTYTLKHNSNIRSNAGTKNKVVTVAKKGATATATHQIKVGKETWYKVKVNGKTGWVLNTLVAKKTVAAKAKTVTKASNSNVSASKVVSIASSLKGIPYVFGGTTTKGFDCSGFTQYVFQKAGKSLSRSTLTQYAQTKAVSSPQPGDLVFFANTYRPGISHVGIYIGNNQFIHAGGAKSEVRSMNESYWKKHFHSYRR